ncbi:MAG: DUF4855 domain-containing protein [Eubacteriales bacterium]|nr:DUF4855 domain-containing protein [Eubacteriales bacterium]MDD4475760.1 DUF4855 domain-containing protein [Eubacteriales bacterium]
METFFNDDYYINTEFTNPRSRNLEKNETEYHNVLKNKEYIIRSVVPLDYRMRNSYSNTQPGNKMLTDGLRAESYLGFDDPAFFHITTGIAREIIFDLEYSCSVDAICIGFGVYPEYGVTPPNKLMVSLSQDGLTWQTVFVDSPKSDLKYGKMQYKGNFGNKYTARYVKVDLYVLSFIWIDEVEVLGCASTVDDALPLKPGYISFNFPDQFPSTSVLDKIKSIISILNYTKSTNQEQKWKKEYFLPLVAYHDSKNKITDTFFDVFQFMPRDMVASWGAYTTSDEAFSYTKKEWLEYLESTFAEDNNLFSLDAAVGEAKTRLFKDNYKAGVLLPILITSPNQTEFGDVDGDGIVENCAIISDRMKVLTWWTELLINRFNICRFKNLKLLGFYWYDESISYDDPDYTNVLFEYSNYVHHKKLKLIWEPWYQAPGIGTWKDFGFDFISMQPNYIWDLDTTIKRLESSIEISKLIGAGVQLEIHPLSLESSVYLNRYRDYLRYYTDAGCQKTICSFYQGIAPGEYYKAYKSSTPSFRSIYDDTYLYVKGKLKHRKIKLKNSHFTINANTVLKSKLQLDIKKSAVVFTTISPPEKGSLELMSDGSFYYYPDRDTTGHDYFTVNYTHSIESQNEKVFICINRL